MEMSVRYDFTVTHEVIEMMEAESKIIVNWSYDYQIAKGSSDKYNLNKDLVEAVEAFKLHLMSMAYIYEVFEHLLRLWMGI
jgi:hypothetical protein